MLERVQNKQPETCEALVFLSTGERVRRQLWPISNRHRAGSAWTGPRGPFGLCQVRWWGFEVFLLIASGQAAELQP